MTLLLWYVLWACVCPSVTSQCFVKMANRMSFFIICGLEATFRAPLCCKGISFSKDMGIPRWKFVQNSGL